LAVINNGTVNIYTELSMLFMSSAFPGIHLGVDLPGHEVAVRLASFEELPDSCPWQLPHLISLLAVLGVVWGGPERRTTLYASSSSIGAQELHSTNGLMQKWF
jgi:hypothetical protein